MIILLLAMVNDYKVSDKAIDIVTNGNMPYRNITSKEYINKLKSGEI